MKKIIIRIIWILIFLLNIYFWFFYNTVDKTELVDAYANINDYPVYDGKNVYEHWKTTLNENQQIVYEEIKEAYLQFKETFGTRVDKISTKEMREAYRAVELDHPEIFWMDYYLVYKTIFNNVYVKKEIELYYSYTLEEAKEIKSKIETTYNEIIEEAKKQDNDFKKIRYVHDKLIEISKKGEYTQEEIEEMQNIVSIFDTGDTVCAGYSYGFKFIMDQLNIKAIATYDIGNEDTSDNHIWNMVNLYGKWYNIDITWDYIKDYISYNYFLKDNEDFYTDHKMQYGIPTN